ncbi:MAG: DUF4239 domain-containing protein [Acetobacteraceae bacterium]
MWGSPMPDPGYVMVIALVLATGLIGAGLAWVTRRYVHLDVLRRHHEVGSAVFLQLGVLFAVLLAFVFNEVWSEYNSAADAIEQECGALNGVAMLSAALPAASRQQVQSLLAAYTDDVITREFPAMVHRRADIHSEVAFQSLWLGVAALPGVREQDTVLRGAMLSLVERAHQNRDLRLFQMSTGLPGLIWLLLLSFVVVLVAFLLFFAVEYIVSQMIFTGAFAACLVFILLVVKLLDFPFEGVLRLAPTDFQETAQKIATLPGG